MGQHEEVIRLVFEPDTSKVRPAVEKAVNDVNERARQHVSGGGGGGSTSGPKVATDAAAPLFGSTSRAFTAADFMQRILGARGAAPSFNPVAGHARIINPGGSVSFSQVRRVAAGFGGAGAPPVPPTGGTAGAGGGGAIVRTGGALAGAGTGGAAAAGIIGVGIAAVIARLRSDAKAFGEVLGGVRTALGTITSGDASRAIKGFVGALQGSARLIGNAVGGPMLGALFSRVIGLGNKFVDALDHLVGSLGKFNPVVAAHARQFEVTQRLFKMKMSAAFQGTQTEWIKLKTNALEAFSWLTPLFRKLDGAISWGIGILNKGFAAAKEGIVNLVTTFTMAANGLRGIFKPISEVRAEVRKMLDEFANPAGKYTGAFLNAGRRMGGGGNGAPAQGGGFDGSGRGPRGIRGGGSGAFQPGAPIPRGPRPVPVASIGGAYAAAHGGMAVNAFIPYRVPPVRLPRYSRAIQLGAWRIAPEPGNVADEPLHTFGGGPERQRSQRILRRFGADVGFRMGTFDQANQGVRRPPPVPLMTSYRSPFEGMKSYSSSNGSDSAAANRPAPDAKTPGRSQWHDPAYDRMKALENGPRAVSKPPSSQPIVSPAMFAAFNRTSTTVHQRFEMKIANERAVHENVLHVRDKLLDAMNTAGLEAQLAMATIDTGSLHG